VTNEFETFYLAKEKSMACDLTESYEKKRHNRISAETTNIACLEADLKESEERKCLISEIAELETKDNG
jgi:hypothetical protein